MATRTEHGSSTTLCVCESNAVALRNSKGTRQDKVGAEQGRSPVRVN